MDEPATVATTLSISAFKENGNDYYWNDYSLLLNMTLPDGTEQECDYHSITSMLNDYVVEQIDGLASSGEVDMEISRLQGVIDACEWLQAELRLHKEAKVAESAAWMGMSPKLASS